MIHNYDKLMLIVNVKNIHIKDVLNVLRAI